MNTYCAEIRDNLPKRIKLFTKQQFYVQCIKKCNAHKIVMGIEADLI